MGSTASKTWSLANGRGVDNKTHGRRTRRKRLWVRPRQKPGPSPTAGGSTTELTEEEKDYGFDRVKDLVPRQRQGGRQQNSRKKKKIMGSTASKTWSLANGRGVDNRTHGRRKRLWVRPRQRPGPWPTAGGSTTELTEEEKDCATSPGTSTETSQCTATGSISLKRIGIVPEARDKLGGTLPRQTVAPLANKKSLPKITSAPQRLLTTTTRTVSGDSVPKDNFNRGTTPSTGIGRPSATTNLGTPTLLNGTNSLRLIPNFLTTKGKTTSISKQDAHNPPPPKKAKTMERTN